MLKGSTAHRAYILEVDRDAQGTKERVTLLVDYGRNQARVEIVVAGLTRKTDQAEIYRGELAELAHALTEIVQSPRGLRWMFAACDAEAPARRKFFAMFSRCLTR